MRRCCLIFVAGVVFGSNAPAEPELRNAIAAIVNDTIITYQEVEEFTTQALELLRRAYFNQPELYKEKRIQTLIDGLDQLLEKQLILDDFKSVGVKVPDSYIDDEIRDRIRHRYRDRAALIKELQAQGITYEMFRQRMHDEIVENFMRQKNVSSAILISPQKIERYYATNLHQFKIGDQVKLRMIVLKRASGGGVEDLRRLAREILAKIEEDASFAEMASVYSEGSQRREGGDWGWKEAANISKGVADIAFAMKPGEHTGVLALAKEPDDAYWVYQYNQAGQIAIARKYTSRDVFVEDKKLATPSSPIEGPDPQEFRLMLVEDKRAARTKLLSEVRDQIEKELTIQERARLHKQWIERLKAKAFVRYFL